MLASWRKVSEGRLVWVGRGGYYPRPDSVRAAVRLRIGAGQGMDYGTKAARFWILLGSAALISTCGGCAGGFLDRSIVAGDLAVDPTASPYPTAVRSTAASATATTAETLAAKTAGIGSTHPAAADAHT